MVSNLDLKNVQHGVDLADQDTAIATASNIHYPLPTRKKLKQILDDKQKPEIMVVTYSCPGLAR
jgi:hypothetical protein